MSQCGTQENSTSDSFQNVFTPLERKTDSIYIPLDSKLGWKYRITDIPVPEGQNKTLTGVIKIRFHESMDISQFPDTFRFKFWIVDSMYNKSNVDSTPDLYRALIGKPKF